MVEGHFLFLSGLRYALSQHSMPPHGAHHLFSGLSVNGAHGDARRCVHHCASIQFCGGLLPVIHVVVGTEKPSPAGGVLLPDITDGFRLLSDVAAGFRAVQSSAAGVLLPLSAVSSEEPSRADGTTVLAA